MTTATNPAFAAINQTFSQIESIYLSPAAKRWIYYKKTRPDGIVMVAAHHQTRFITYGADACNLAARSGLMLEYHSMGGVNIPVVSIEMGWAKHLGTAIRLQGADIDFID